jgi:RNA polymerase sigma factor (sigma-70 family)
MLSLHAVADEAATSAISVVDTILCQEDIERLEGALETLRPEEQEVFMLRQKRGLTYREIAQVRGSPVGTGKTLMRSAIHKLQRILRESEFPLN